MSIYSWKRQLSKSSYFTSFSATLTVFVFNQQVSISHGSVCVWWGQGLDHTTILDKKKQKKNHPRDSRREECCSILWYHARWRTINAGQSLPSATVRDFCPVLIVRHRAWYRTMEQCSSRRESRGWFFFFFLQGSTSNKYMYLRKSAKYISVLCVERRLTALPVFLSCAS